jgi:hypothetical protein
MGEELLEKLVNGYIVKDTEEVTLDKAIEVLENFTKDFQGFKPDSTDSSYFEEAAKAGLADMPIFFGKREPYKSEDEYESQAIAVLLQVGENLLKKIHRGKERKYDLDYIESHHIEEGACNYLAAKLLDIPLDKIPFNDVDGLTTSKEWEKKMGGETKPLIDAIKRGDISFLQLYRT